MSLRRDAVLFLRTMMGRSYPRIIGMQRERSWVFFDTLLPLVATSAYVFIYRAVQAPPEFTGFVILGGAMTAYWMNVLWSMASQLYWDKEAGNLALYIMTPAPLMAVLLGMALGGMLATTLRAGAVLILGSLVFNVRFAVADWPLLLTIFLVTVVALYGLGMLFASLFLMYGREAWHLSNLFTEPVFLLSGFYFPVKSLPFWLSAGASLIPITLGLDAMRQLIYPSARWGFLPVSTEMSLLLALSALFLYVAYLALRYMEERARRDGRLTVRGQ